MAGQDWMEKDFYKVLGVSKDATDAEIKKSYRKLARKYHPDQNPDDKNAEERFKAVGEAYQVLSDPEQRKQYDAIRAMASGGARFSAGPGGGASGFEDIFSMFSGGGGNGSRVRFSTSGNTSAGGAGFEDILSNLFGGAASSGAPGGNFANYSDYQGRGAFGQQPQKGADLAASTTLTLRQAVEGATLKMSVEGRSMTVRIPAGVTDGQKLRLRGKGRPGANGGPAGDLVVSITIEKHPVFHMEGQNLHMKLPISYGEAALGAGVAVPMMDGSTVTVKIPAGTSSGTHLRLRKRGVKKGRKRGDLIIEIEIAVPKNLSADAKDAVKKLAEATSDWDPREGLAEKVRK
ncbi:MAG TPA: DnaJ domain-containing protein [Actinomyces sp.]|jgi:molecular chaperone DnaJ|nr:DnaJ C-terminal domain-containing protein [Acidobacteriota bacterium]HHT40979.1 DnaJ domain-containing protein [Actinomyces sp.]